MIVIACAQKPLVIGLEPAGVMVRMANKMHVQLVFRSVMQPLVRVNTMVCSKVAGLHVHSAAPLNVGIPHSMKRSAACKSWVLLL